jgi:hypothetical protein
VVSFTDKIASLTAGLDTATAHVAAQALWLDALPLLARDAGLAEDDGEEFRADVAFVGIRDREDELTAYHELVLAAR